VSRILQPCPSCARMLDVAQIAVGQRIRCACGNVSTVAPPAPIAVRTFTCRRCGGAFQAGAIACPYCEAGIALEDRNLAGVCGRCFARLAAGTHFCPGCGIEIRDQVLKPLAEAAQCPRCKSALRTRKVDENELVECSGCGGLWLQPDQFATFCTHAEDDGGLRRALDAALPPPQPVAETRVMYLPCPTCHELMMRKNFGGSSGVVIDLCKNHGVWLDHRELERVLDYVQKGGLSRERERLAREERERRSKEVALLPGMSLDGRDDGYSGSAADIVIEGLFEGLSRLASRMRRR
jgi:Zn-finger nucleic acid-binding protein